MSLYPSLALTADDLLSEFGQPVTIRHTESAYDPATGTTTETITDTGTVGAKLPYGDRQIDGTLILSNDEQLYVSPVGVSSIVPGDRVIIGSDAYSVVRVKTTAPAGVDVIHELQIRR